jgi:hypothetical protein
MFDPREIVGTLIRDKVEFVLIGGVAATLHGCPEQTFDLDILYANTPDNRQRLLAALRELGAQWDEPLTDAVLRRQPMFALNTRCGDLDIFTVIPGLGGYREATSHIRWMELGQTKVSVLDLPTLIQTKEAAADPNPRKQAALAYLKSLQQQT